MSLLREHFTAQGTPKVGYSKKVAEVKAADSGMRCYECPLCGKWHLATPRFRHKRMN